MFLFFNFVFSFQIVFALGEYVGLNTDVAQPKGEWKTEDIATVGEVLLDISIQLARTWVIPFNCFVYSLHSKYWKHVIWYCDTVTPSVKKKWCIWLRSCWSNIDSTFDWENGRNLYFERTRRSFSVSPQDHMPFSVLLRAGVCVCVRTKSRE